MKKQFAVTLFLAWAVVFTMVGNCPAVKFRYENLGTLGGFQVYADFFRKEAGINESGQVVGKSFTASGSLHAFVKSPGQAMVDLDNIPGSTESLATCINSSGVISGYYKSVEHHACLWVPGAGGYSFGTLSINPCEAWGINNSGYVVGWAGAANYHAFVKGWGPSPPLQDLGTLPLIGHLRSMATGINSARTIVGFSSDNSFISTACFWSPSGGGYTTAALLFGVADSEANAINNLGQAVGWVRVSGLWHAVLQSPGQLLQHLGTLVDPGHSMAMDINDSGWVVGWASSGDGTRAFLWTQAGGMQDLHSLVLNLPSGVRLRYAMAINKRGEIAGYTDNGVFRLTPVVGPPLNLLLFD